MDLPPSGWYPDPYGVPELLRWWDGSAWTQHTHKDDGTAAAGGAEAAGPAATAEQPVLQQPPVQQGAGQQGAGQQPNGQQPDGQQPNGRQTAAVQQTAVQPTAVKQTVPQPVAAVPPATVTVQPATGGQPAAPPTTVQPTTVQPATAQPGAAQGGAAQPAAMQPTTVQPTTVQPTTVQPGTQLPAVMQVGAAAPEAIGAAGVRPAFPATGGRPDDGANGTQVLFIGDDAWPGHGASGGAAPGDWYGYQRAQRRRRMWLAGGLAAGTVAALGVIALVVNALAQTSSPTAAVTSPSQPAAPTTPAAAATTPASPSATATAAGSTLTDGQSGLSYTQLPNPWQPSCPGGLNNQGFTWTAGESAVAGQVNGGQTTWYGTACSGPLPQQYGYNGVADLDNVATQLANQFNGTYYSSLTHNFQQEVSQPLQVSGHAGWEVKFLITYTNPQGQGLSWNDELGAVVVADSGTGSAPAVFYVSIPGNLGESNVDTLVSSLQLTAVAPQQGGSPGPGGSPAA
jgi:hypothetical protein